MTADPTITAELSLRDFTSPPEVRPVVVEHAALSDRGLRRSRNEDAFLADPPVFAVADGMGGSRAGHVAARLAVQELASTSLPSLTRRDGLGTSFREANDRIRATAETVPAYAGMGTTLTAVVVSNGRLRVAHVGDSRLYRIRKGSLDRLTRDHTYVEELVRRGRRPTPDQARRWRSIIARAVGVEPSVDVDAMTYPGAPGDVHLLCSDGLTNMLSDSEIVDVVVSSATLDDAARALVGRANANGGRDNVTAVLFRLDVQGGVTSHTPSRPVSVVVAHGDAAYRDALTGAIASRSDLRLVGETGNGFEAARLIARRHPDVAVVDVQTRSLDGIAICEQVAARGTSSRTRVVLTDTDPDPARLRKSLDAGAAGYVTSDLSSERVVDSVLRVARGGTDFSPASGRPVAA
jgi:serine/threonine protein phosphatase PrpC/ActR/RegA family two-component response regulator